MCEPVTFGACTERTDQRIESLRTGSRAPDHFTSLAMSLTMDQIVWRLADCLGSTGDHLPRSRYHAGLVGRPSHMDVSCILQCVY